MCYKACYGSRTDISVGKGNNGTPTRLARGLVIMQCVLSGLAQLPVLKYVLEMQLAMVPYKALPRLRLWTLLSCAFFDLRPLAAIMNVAVCAVCARPAELAIGRRSMCAMIALATTVAAVFVSASTLVVYAAVPMGKLMYVIGCVHYQLQHFANIIVTVLRQLLPRPG